MFDHNGDRVKRAQDYLALVALAPQDAGPSRNKAMAWAELLTIWTHDSDPRLTHGLILVLAEEVEGHAAVTVAAEAGRCGHALYDIDGLAVELGSYAVAVMILKLTGAAYDDRAGAWTDREHGDSTPVAVQFTSGFVGRVLADLAADFAAPSDE